MTQSATQSSGPWWRELNRYHWFVLMVAALGWLFDCLDQQLFNLARTPAMKALLRPDQNVVEYGGYATSIFLIGWATGGLFFGVLGDRIGRAKTMMWTILIYSVCTGLSAFSRSFWDFAFYRFITGLGVGGEFAVGVALVAEVMPARARPYALAMLQALSTVGNISAALISMYFGHLEKSGVFNQGQSWRYMFLVGAAPALLALVVRSRLKEPEAWHVAKKAGTLKLGSYSALFSVVRWRRNAIVGVLLAFTGVVGLWGIGFFVFELVRSVLKAGFVAKGLSPDAVAGELTFWAGVASMMLNLGAFFGMNLFGIFAERFGRRPSFAIAFIAALISTSAVFWFFNEKAHIFWMIPIMGVCQLALFAGYAIYFPELFPTHLRSTGTSFCYNVGRFVAAAGPTLLGVLTSKVYAGYPEPFPIRYAGVTMCAIFILGLLVLPFAQETKGKALPESERGFNH